MPLVDLIVHIVQVQNSYVKEKIPLLIEFTRKIAEVHGDTNPELKIISELFYEMAGELQLHMMKEEHMLFPYIKCIVNPENYPESGECGHFGSVQNPIDMMMYKHESAGEALRKKLELCDHYKFPDHASNTYKLKFFSD